MTSNYPGHLYTSTGNNDNNTNDYSNGNTNYYNNYESLAGNSPRIETPSAPPQDNNNPIPSASYMPPSSSSSSSNLFPSEFIKPAPRYEPVKDLESGKGYQDSYQNNVNDDDNVDKMLRMAFIRKVYTILTLQLAITTAVASYLSLNEAARFFVFSNPGLLWVAFGLSFGTIIALFCYKQRHPYNMILLGVFTLVEAYTIGVVCAIYTSQDNGFLVVEAAGITMTIFLGLTLFTCFSKIDFSFMGAGLYMCLHVLIFWGLFQWLFGWHTGAIYSLFGSILFSGYIIYDTFLIMKKYNYDQYIQAAIQLYLDIINLFLHILRLLAASKRN